MLVQLVEHVLREVVVVVLLLLGKGASALVGKLEGKRRSVVTSSYIVVTY